jgi:NitT/TauT family transport system substrate-binding protein
VLVDESDLWPGGRFATTELVVRAGFLRAHPSVVAGLVEAQVRTTDFLQRRPEEAQRLTAEALADLGGKRLPDAVVARAWANLSFDDDPLYDSLRLDAEHAQRLGLLPPASLAGICDLSLLNAALARAGEAPVDCR